MCDRNQWQLRKTDITAGSGDHCCWEITAVGAVWLGYKLAQQAYRTVIASGVETAANNCKE